MGASFYIPIILMILGIVYTLVFQQKFGEANVLIKQGFGMFSFPFITIWILYLFEDLLDSDGKETLLALPYKNIQYGFLRVLKFTLVYVITFYLFYLSTAFLFKERVYFQLQDSYLPVASILFYSALSFLIITLVKKILIAFLIIALHSSFLYGTRGGVSAYIYPLQWFHPNPYYSPRLVALVLLFSAIILYVLGQYLFSKREFLMK